MDDKDRLSPRTKIILLIAIVLSAVLVFFCAILCPYLLSYFCRKLKPHKTVIPQRRRRAAIAHFEPAVTVDDIDSLDESSINEELKRTMSARSDI